MKNAIPSSPPAAVTGNLGHAKSSAGDASAESLPFGELLGASLEALATGFPGESPVTLPAVLPEDGLEPGLDAALAGDATPGPAALIEQMFPGATEPALTPLASSPPAPAAMATVIATTESRTGENPDPSIPPTMIAGDRIAPFSAAPTPGNAPPGTLSGPPAGKREKAVEAAPVALHSSSAPQDSESSNWRESARLAFVDATGPRTQQEAPFGNQNGLAAGAGPAMANPSDFVSSRLENIPQRVGTPAWDNALSNRVTWMATHEMRSAEIQLNPPDLGPISIALSLSGDSDAVASVQFSALHPATVEAIQAALPKLRDMLEAAGISLGQTSVSSGQEGRENTGGSSGHTQRGRASPDTPASLAPPQRSSRGNGLVDTFA
ncbi:MAG: flagellar hook-length control protein FliK [Burkholderiales bacterium]